MKSHLILLNILTLSALAAVLLVAQGNGPLDPPAPPANGVYKTLNQVEPRTPISQDDLPLTISQSGSYYFQENLHFSAATGHAITIAVPDVSLDLMGFTLSSSAGVTGHGIHIGPGAHRTSICNGKVRGTTVVDVGFQSWTVTPGGFARGVATSEAGDVFTEFPYQCRVERLQVVGCREIGIQGGAGAHISRCAADHNGAGGIVCGGGTISECTAFYNGDAAVTIKDAILAGNVGVAAIFNTGGVVRDSHAYWNGLTGIRAEVTHHCASQGNGGDGIAMINDGVVTSCSASGNGGLDISGTGTRTGNDPSP